MASRLIPDFAEADSPLADWSLSLSNQLRARLEDKAAALRVGKGKGSLGDYLRTAARVPGALITNLADSAVSGLTLPGDVYTGKTKVPLVPSSDPEASNELVKRALDLTGTIGSATLAAPRGAIGSGAVLPDLTKTGWSFKDVAFPHKLMEPGDWRKVTRAVESGEGVIDAELPIRSLNATQETVNPDFANTISRDKNVKAPLVIKKAGQYFVQDGHHRIVARAAEGKQTAKVRLVDLDGTTQTDFPLLSDKGLLYAGGKSSAVPGLAVLSDPFYSHLERVVSRGPASASPEQWLATIRNGGVKSEELEWSGVDKALAGKTGPVSKEELAAMVKGAKPEIKEVVKKGSSQDDLDARFENGDISEQEYEDLLAQNVKEAGPKFSQYQLPGGENYREVLLTMPSTEYNARVRDWAKKEGINDVQDAYSKFEQQFGKPFSSQDFRSSHWDEPNVLVHMRLNDRYLPRATERRLSPAERQVRGESSDIGNYYDKTLFAEEIQSDWHQKGRKEGYKTNPEDEVARRLSTGQSSLKQLPTGEWVARWIADDPVTQPGFITGEETRARQYLLDNAKEGYGNQVPDAPFKKTWPDLALKRIVREAAEKGYDQVAWTDGATQADRYDLSKQVNSIDVKPRFSDPDAPPSAHHVVVNARSGVHASGLVDGEGKIIQGYDAFRDATGKHLSDVVGKEMAEKIMATTEPVKFSGLDLKVGGEGMKGFYDKILPAQANKLFGKYGAKVEQNSVGTGAYKIVEHPDEDGWMIENDAGEDMTGAVFNNREEAADYADQFHDGESKKSGVHVLPITPELRRAALSEGFPLFSGGVPLPGDPDHRRIRLTPVEHTPTFTEPANGARMSAQPAGNPAGGRVVRLTPVEHDPFAT